MNIFYTNIAHHLRSQIPHKNKLSETLLFRNVVALKRAGGQNDGKEVVLGLSSLLRLLRQEDSLDIGENTTLGNGDSSQKLVQLLIIADGQL